MPKVINALILILFGTVKFAFVPAVSMYTYHFTFIESLTCSIISGLGGTYVFYFLSAEALIAWNFFVRFLKKHISQKPHHHPKVFSNRSRRIVKVKQRWGLYGVIVLTPCILTLPLGAFLAARFYPGTRTILLLSLSVIGWAIILNCAYLYVGHLF